MRNFISLKASTLVVLSLIVLFLALTVSQNDSTSTELFLFKKSPGQLHGTSNWVVNGRYSKAESACIENCMRQGGVNCGGVLFFACCSSDQDCKTYPLGITRCANKLNDFSCFRPS